MDSRAREILRGTCDLLRSEMPRLRALAVNYNICECIDKWPQVEINILGRVSNLCIYSSCLSLRIYVCFMCFKFADFHYDEYSP